MGELRFGSVCSGVEAASLAWEPLGMKPAWFAEIDPFCKELLKQRWPNVPNLGDLTAEDFVERAKREGKIDVLVGGTPCQAFSTAGKRKGFDDERGNLTKRYFRVVEELRPTWFVWENVPGVLTLDGGRTFGTILGKVAELGYGWAYRVLDARWFGVPQRRRRVFLIGHSRDARLPEAVLLEPQGQGRDPQAGGEKREETARTAREGVEGRNRGGRGGVTPTAARNSGRGWWSEDGTAATIGTQGRGVNESTLVVDEAKIFSNSGTQCWSESVGTLRARDHKDGEGQGLVVAPIAFDTKKNATPGRESPTLRGMNAVASRANGGGQVGVVVPIDMRQASRGENLSNVRRPGTVSGGPPGTGVGKEGDPSPSLCDSHTPAVVISIHSDASREGTAATPSPDAEGRVRLRDPGLGVAEDGTSYTLAAAGTHAVAYARNEVVGVLGEHSHTLTAEGFDASEDGTGRGCLVVAHRSPGEVFTVGMGSDVIHTKDLAQPVTGRNGDPGVVVWQCHGNNVGPLGTGNGNTAGGVPFAAYGISSDSVDRSGEGKAGDAASRAGLGIVENESPSLRARSTNSVAAPVLEIEEGIQLEIPFPEDSEEVAVVCFQERGRKDGPTLEVSKEDAAYALTAPSGGSRSQEKNIAVRLSGGRVRYVVRRLTPLECERLQGMPDNHTLIPWKGKALSKHALEIKAHLELLLGRTLADKEVKEFVSDSLRYKAIGNSFAVPVVHWIGRRLLEVHQKNEEGKE